MLKCCVFHCTVGARSSNLSVCADRWSALFGSQRWVRDRTRQEFAVADFERDGRRAVGSNYWRRSGRDARVVGGLRPQTRFRPRISPRPPSPRVPTVHLALRALQTALSGSVNDG